MSSISISIYQIGVSAKTPPKPIGFTTANIGNIWETNRDGSQLDGKVNAAVQAFVNSGFEYTDEKLNKNIYYCAETKDELIIKINSSATSTQPVNEDAEVTGVSAETTTTYLSYGVNVVTTSDASNYAIRLPYPPVKGRTVTIINTTSIPIVVYPSITGGSINGVVNGTATIPADNNAYTFTCWENPLPGAWSWTPPSTNQLVSVDLTVSHTNGVASLAYFNLAGATAASVTSGVSAGVLQLGGPWFTNTTPIIINKIKCYTSIRYAQLPAFATDIFQVGVTQVRLTNQTTVTTINILDQDLNQAEVDDPSFTAPNLQAQETVGATTTPPALGDINSIYTFGEVALTNTIAERTIGGGKYITLFAQIDETAPTQDYVFKFFIEYN
jgi:hypothetical protein